jgi:hypothetical protein
MLYDASMLKRCLIVLAVCVFSMATYNVLAFAQNAGGIAVAAGYAKGNSRFDIVVKEVPGTKLALYVNDSNPHKATVNKKGWATFRGVKLTGSGKISFTKIKTSNHGSYEKPINYTRQYTVANGKVSFSAVAVAAPSAPPTVPNQTPASSTPAPSCDPNYSGACVPIASDVDCAGGSGNGPAYVRGPVRVVGTDIYGLDRDGNGVGCE